MSKRMCGKYGGPAELVVFAGYLDVPPPFKKMNAEDYRPMSTVSVLTKNAAGETVMKEMRWGLIPARYTGFASAWTASTFHACLETVATKPSFENAWARKRRVIFPMRHYTEKTNAKLDLLGGSRGQVRVAITRADDKPLGVAGIWDYARYTAEGPILSVAMLTRAPGPRMMEIHDREPVVLEPEQFEAWLSGSDDIDLGRPWADEAFNVRMAA